MMQHNMRTFYTLILTQTFSLIGSRISGLAIAIWVFGETGNATPLALVSFFGALPMVLASSISGVLADRWDRRYVMVIADAGQALGTFLLLLSVASGDFQLWHLYVVTLIQSVFGVFQGPAFQASVTMLVPDNQRDRANAIQQMTSPAAGVIAPVIAAGVYGLVGLNGAILADLLTFVAAAAVVLLVHIPRPAQTAEGLAAKGSVWKEMWSGLGYLRKRRSLLFLVLYICIVNFLIAGVMTLTTPYVLARTGNSEALLGLFLGLSNMGMLVGGIIMGVWGGTRPRIHTVMGGILIISLMLMLVGTAQSVVWLGITVTLLLLPIAPINAAVMSIMQTKVAPDLQGRVFAALGQISILLLPLSYLLIGPLTDVVFEPAVGLAGWERVAPLVGNTPGAGMGLLMLIAGAGITVISLVVYSLPAVRQMEANLPDYVPVATEEFAAEAVLEIAAAPQPDLPLA